MRKNNFKPLTLEGLNLPDETKKLLIRGSNAVWGDPKMKYNKTAMQPFAKPKITGVT